MRGIRKRLGIHDSRTQFICAIAKPEMEMYLRVAKEFADDANDEMCSAVLERAAQVLAGKAMLAKPLAIEHQNQGKRRS